MNQEEFDQYTRIVDMALGQTTEQGETKLEDLTEEGLREYMRYYANAEKEYVLSLDEKQLREVIVGLEGRLAHYRYNIDLDEQRDNLNETQAWRLERCRRSLAETQTLRNALRVIYLKR